MIKEDIMSKPRKFKRRLKRKRKKKQLPKGVITKHHLIPKSRGGLTNSKNLLRLDLQKHICWHKLFGNRTLDEVIAELQRVKRIKEKL